MNKRLYVWLSLLLSLALLAACVSNIPAPAQEAAPAQESAAAETEAEGMPDLGGQEVTIAVENAYPPFNSIDPDSNEGVGWDYDAWREICSRLNCTPVFVEAAWDGIFEAMAAGEYDVLADGVTVTAERDEVIDYSIPYVEYGQAMLVRVDESVIVDAESLAGAEDKVVGTQPGTTNEAIALDLVGEDRIRSFKDFPLAVEALKAGDVDVVFVDEVIAINYVNESDGALKVAGNATSGEYLAFVFESGSDLIPAVNSALEAMAADGALEALNNKWFKGE